MGKAIPLTDMTYLRGFQQQIEELHPEAHERHLDLKPQVQVVAVRGLAKENKEMREEVESLKSKVNEAMKMLKEITSKY